MHEARARGWTSRIGASVYNSDQLALVESRFQPQLVQLPLNVLDRRPIVSGMLARLKAAGVEIHARSVFLQGLLLMEPDELPEFFAPVRPIFVGLREKWQQRGLAPLAWVSCLRFATARNRCRHCRRQSHERVCTDRGSGRVVDEVTNRYRHRPADGHGLPRSEPMAGFCALSGMTMDLENIKRHWTEWAKAGVDLRATTKTGTVKSLEIAALVRAIRRTGSESRQRTVSGGGLR